MALLNFNAAEVEPSTGFEAIPAGRYNAVISESTFKSNRAGTGGYLELEFTIIDGDFKNRKLWSRLNLDNPKAEAVRIAQADLSAICHAVGVLNPTDSAELHDLPLVICVRRKLNSDDEWTNEIKGYLPRETAAPAPRETAKASIPAGDPNLPPWARK